MTQRSSWTTYDWIKLLGTVLLVILLLLCRGGIFGGRGASLIPPTLLTPAIGSLFNTPTVDFSGTGEPGGLLRLMLGGKALSAAPVQIGTDGKWFLPGVDLSKLGLSPGDYALELQTLDKADPRRVLSTKSLNFTLPGFSSGAGTLGFSEPKDGSEVPAGSFVLRGVGKPGDTLEVFEDSTSLGTVRVNPDGTWTLSVPPASAGAHTYKAVGSNQTEASIRLNIAQASGQASCTDKTFALANLSDGGLVNKPFRFGGQGSAQGYTITVKREGRVIGSKELTLDSTCGWSYTSNPGSGKITYEVRESSAAPDSPALSTINLEVR